MEATLAPILLIDDNPAECELLTMAFVDVAGEGLVDCTSEAEQAALTLLGREPEDNPRLVLLDLNMPRFGGKDVLRTLARKPRLNGIRVVMFTTSARQDDIDECMRLGAHWYVVKPRDYEELLSTARELLSLAELGPL